jgi:muramoyltetrapeptide carboxypeptidase LdcA involved in peptidoglycan recycling
MQFVELRKLEPGDAVAILSPSFAAPGKWPNVHALGLQRLREIFHLEPVEFPTTRQLNASKEERARDLMAAFEDERIKGVISSLGGDDQVTYVKNLPDGPFRKHPKPFFGFSDNTNFMNFLWLCGVPSYYGGALFTQFAEQGELHPFTCKYLERALFERGEFELEASREYNDIGLNWNDPDNLARRRTYEPNEGWYWDGSEAAQGITWGGCLESIDEILRHGVAMPSLKDFEEIVLITETSEELPGAETVYRIYRALGERGILERIKAVLVGRPKAWEFDRPQTPEQKRVYKAEQREISLEIIRRYNPAIPIVQNLDFGHTDPQIPIPYGRKARIEAEEKRLFVEF